jgi:hypothetical protein
MRALVLNRSNPKGSLELKPFLLEATLGERRMFSNRIANSARFLQMPAETQLLYFHFILRADDDGIVESYPIMKLLGLATDNYKILLAKGYVKELNEDQVIVITDWLEHNYIRADRKINSIYLPLLQNKYPELPVIEPQPRSDVEDNSRRLNGQSTDGISKVKLGKVNISKDSIEYKTTKLFFINLMSINNPSAYKNRRPDLLKWSKHIKLLHDINDIDYKEMERTWLWAMNDNFWKSNILSTEKFREKFDTLKLQMANKPKDQLNYNNNELINKIFEGENK